MELPLLQPLYDKHKKAGFNIVAIEALGMDEQAKKFIRDKNLTYTFISAGGRKNELVSGVFGVTSYPTSFLIDENGRVIYAHEGFYVGFEKVIEEEILSLMN